MEDQWIDPAKEWPDDGQKVLMAMTKVVNGCEMGHHIRSADTVGIMMRDEYGTDTRFRKGTAWYRDWRLDGWMPAPRHPAT